MIPFLPKPCIDMTNQDNCNHSVSAKMPELMNKRECLLCHKIFEDG